MDYAFAPGKTRQDGRVRAMFSRRSNTTLISRKSLITVRGFINFLATDTSVTRPIEDILLGAHANAFAGCEFFMPLFPKSDGRTDFELLETSLTDSTKSVQIPDSVIGYQAGNPITNSLHFKGCNIGKQPKFLAKFKEALGSHVDVTAPVHFHGLTPEPGYGVFEYMAYEFAIMQPDPFAKQADAITAFDGEGFKLIDGTTTVPTPAWSKWIPKRIGSGRSDQIPSSLGGMTLGSRRRKTILTPRQFRIERRPVPYTIQYPSKSDIPKTDSDRLDALKNAMQSDAKWQSTHPFPKYERLGYSDFESFFDGYNWTCKPVKTSLVCNGRRYRYVVEVPINDPATFLDATDPATGNKFKDPGTGTLFFNFYPDAGSGLAESTSALQTSDAKFFASA